MKTTRDYFNYLLDKYKNLEKSDVYEILEEVLKQSYTDLVLDFDYVLTDKEKDKMMLAMKQLDQNYPLAYITKRKAFHKNNFYVNENVLIPRNDTEVVVEQALEFLNDNPDSTVYDICTGSGIIGLSLKFEKPSINLYLSDVSKEAIDVAKENALLLDIQNVNFLIGDFLKPFKNEPKANLIVCNPPYIDINDIDVQDSVREYEPKQALFAKDNGLYFYELMAKSYDKFIDTTKKFMIVMEIGYKQKDQIEDIFKKSVSKDIKIEFSKDLSGNWRSVKIFN